MTLVSTVTVGSGGAATIDFTSIPQTGTDLLVVISSRNDIGATAYYCRFNSDSGSNYNWIRLLGDGSTASSSAGPSTQFILQANNANDTANTFNNSSIYITNYAGSTSKSVSIDTVKENNATAANQMIQAGNWSGTAAITTITLLPNSGNFAQYSTASLYTIQKGSGGASVS